MGGGSYHSDSRMVYAVRTVAQLMEPGQLIPAEHMKALEAHGVKPVHDKGMFVHPSSVTKKLLRDTVWKELNIRDILLRADGAEAVQLRLAGSPVRGVVIPWATIGTLEPDA